MRQVRRTLYPYSQTQRMEVKPMADKEWTMNCILAGVEAGLQVKANKLQKATECLANLTSELTTLDIQYLLTRVLDILKKDE